MMAPIFIGIAGCSGSGKTWLAQKALNTYNSRVSLFSIDWYYRDLSHLPRNIASKTNFDNPSSIDKTLLLKDLDQLRKGYDIAAPIYDFATFSRSNVRQTPLSPSPIIIVEGIFALHFPELRKLYSESVFVDTPIELCYQRRLLRDQQERGYSEEQIRTMWEETVVDSYEYFVKPSASRASKVWKSEEDKAFVNQFLADLEAYLAGNGNAPSFER